LEALLARHSTPQSVARRAQIVLLLGDGLSQGEVARRVGVTRPVVAKWLKRFVESGLDGLDDAPRSGRPRTVLDEQVADIVRQTLETTPKGQTHWSQRQMAQRVGLSHQTVGRIWRAFGLKPHLVEGFRLSNDPYFVDKVHDIVGLYVAPPVHAVVLSVDEKTQLQATERAAPVVPMQPAQPERRSTEYVRHGTTNLFAALDVATGEVIGQMKHRKRAREFVEFLGFVDRHVPADLDLHLILDNINTHKAPAVKAWLLDHPRVELHFVPTYSSWLNAVEGFFALLQRRAVERGTFTSVKALEQAVMGYIEAHNKETKPFVWTKPADEILKKVRRYCERTIRLRDAASR
jgi:transposase